MPAHNEFGSTRGGLESPATDAFAVTPSDSVDLEFVTRAIYIGVSGDLNCLMQSGRTILFKNMVGGVEYPRRIKRVLATGTTATDMVGLT